MKVFNLNKLSNLVNESNQILVNKNIFKNMENFYLNYKISRILDKKLSDFSEYHFPEQIKIIYEDTRKAIIRQEFPILIKSIVNFKFTESSLIIDKINKDYLLNLLQNFDSDSFNWKLRFIRNTDDNTTAYAVLEYSSSKERKYIKVLRDLSETKSFYSWRILI